MAAKTFAYATGCRLLAIDTFLALAWQAPPDADMVEVIADAQQRRIYVQCFIRAAPTGIWQPASSLVIQDLDDWLSERDRAAVVTGPGLRTYLSDLPPDTVVVGDQEWDPRPDTLLRIGLARYEAGESDDVWTVEPLYLRPSSAEEKWRSRDMV
jgi:tRNA threonylcarbamoyladenosine biosynthesis protein TsaB